MPERLMVNNEPIDAQSSIDGASIMCGHCGATFQPTTKYKISRSRIEVDILNGCCIGTEFVICPVCQRNHYF